MMMHLLKEIRWLSLRHMQPLKRRIRPWSELIWGISHQGPKRTLHALCIRNYVLKTKVIASGYQCAIFQDIYLETNLKNQNLLRMMKILILIIKNNNQKSKLKNRLIQIKQAQIARLNGISEWIFILQLINIKNWFV